MSICERARERATRPERAGAAARERACGESEGRSPSGKTMTIGRRLLVLVAVPLVALLLFGIFARIRLAEVESRSRFVAETQLGSVAALASITAGFAELRVSVRNSLLAADGGERAAARAAFDQDEKELAQLLQQYGASLISDERDRQLLAQVEDLNRQYVAEARQVMALAEEGRHDEALARFRITAGPTGVTLTNVSSEWIQYNKDLGSTAARAALDAIDATRSQILAVNRGRAPADRSRRLPDLPPHRHADSGSRTIRQVRRGGGLHAVGSVYRGH